MVLCIQQKKRNFAGFLGIKRVDGPMWIHGAGLSVTQSENTAKPNIRAAKIRRSRTYAQRKYGKAEHTR